MIVCRQVLKHLLGNPALKGGSTCGVLQDADAEQALQGLTRTSGAAYFSRIFSALRRVTSRSDPASFTVTRSM